MQLEDLPPLQWRERGALLGNLLQSYEALL